MSAATFRPTREIWLRPAGTLRRITRENPQHWVLLLPALAGLLPSLIDFSDHRSGYLVRSLVSHGVFGELLQLLIMGYLVNALSPWFGGRDGSHMTYLVIAWSNIPLISTGAIWLVLFAFLAAAGLEPSGGLDQWMMSWRTVALFAVQLAIAGCCVYILVSGTAAALGLSAVRAAACLMVSWLLITLFLGVCVGALGGRSAMQSVFLPEF